MNKAKAITNSITQNRDIQHTLFRVLIGVLMVLFIVYIYLIGSITFNVLARKSLESTVRVMGSNISKLELTYLSNANKIDKNFAKSLGFVDINKNIFATRGASRVAHR